MVRDFIVHVMMYSVNRRIPAFGSAGDLKRHIAANGAPDIILSEAYLPDAPDFNLLRTIKASHPSIHFIVLSADPAAESKAAALGADAFLAKPFSLKDLFGIVERFVVNEGPGHEG